MVKPTLAVAADFSKIKYPVIGSPKLDGIRCLIVNGVAKSRTLKDIPNKRIHLELSLAELTGLDGELIFGDPTSKTVYRDTVSQVMGHDKEHEGVTFYVFDLHNGMGPYSKRAMQLVTTMKAIEGLSAVRIELLSNRVLNNEEEMLEYEVDCVAAGYEGIILRSPAAPYKYGRSTVGEGYLLKVKRFEDAEAEIIGFEEEMFNGNVAETNELGRTKRSSAQAGKSGKNTLGAFLVRDLLSGVEFAIGTVLTAADRADFWARRTQLYGALVKYKFFPVGVKTAPRHPVFLGFRDKSDV